MPQDCPTLTSSKSICILVRGIFKAPFRPVPLIRNRWTNTGHPNVKWDAMRARRMIIVYGAIVTI